MSLRLNVYPPMERGGVIPLAHLIFEYDHSHGWARSTEEIHNRTSKNMPALLLRSVVQGTSCYGLTVRCIDFFID